MTGHPKLPRLDARLAAIAELVREGRSCTDVGTDHGMLIAWLTASGKIPGGCACDIHEKPLAKAAFTLSEYGVSDRVRLCLSDGLDGVHPDEAQEIIIAGMGGDLILEILTRPLWTRDPSRHLLLQPMTKADRLRRGLYAAGWRIEAERAVLAGDFPYAIMQAAYTGERHEVSDCFAWGGLLLDDPDPAAGRLLTKTIALVREKVQGLRQGRDRDASARYTALLNELEEHQ